MPANIVLMHGIFGRYWCAAIRSNDFNGVGRSLVRTIGASVLSVQSSPFKSTEGRAEDAAGQIRLALAKRLLHPGIPIHIVAHSTGGLDARYLISKNILGLTGQIASLVCVGTPHWGLPFASAVLSAVTATPMGRLVPTAIFQLCEAPARTFDDRCPDVPSVQYFEIAGTGRHGLIPTAVILGPLFAFLRLSGETQSDGIVPLSSACRGRPPLALWPEDHVGLIGANLDQPFVFAGYTHVRRYEQLVHQISTPVHRRHG